MSTMKVLVVYYSRTGTTAKLARAIAAATGGQIEVLEDTVDRSGFFGFVRSIRDAASRRPTMLKPLHVDPGDFDLVIVGTPDWGKSASAPVRTFLLQNHSHLHQVAFFLTDGESDHAQVFRDMAILAGSAPVAVLGIPHAEVERGEYPGRVSEFVKSLAVSMFVPPLKTSPQVEAHP